MTSTLEPETARIPRHQAEPSRRKSVLAGVRTVILDIAAAGGAICIVLVLLALFLHVSLIMFKTGSMAPTLPTGSLAVVREVPGSSVHPGQIVTVSRPGQLPITHRIVSARPDRNGETRLVLKGDANRQADPRPYLVKQVRLVLWGAPGLAYVIVWFGNPFVIGGLTLAVAALVTWVLWPAGRRRRADEAS